jgi:hypothetical protein
VIAVKSVPPCSQAYRTAAAFEWALDWFTPDWYDRGLHNQRLARQRVRKKSVEVEGLVIQAKLRAQLTGPTICRITAHSGRVSDWHRTSRPGQNKKDAQSDLHNGRAKQDMRRVEKRKNQQQEHEAQHQKMFLDSIKCGNQLVAPLRFGPRLQKGSHHDHIGTTDQNYGRHEPKDQHGDIGQKKPSRAISPNVKSAMIRVSDSRILVQMNSPKCRHQECVLRQVKPLFF